MKLNWPPLIFFRQFYLVRILFARGWRCQDGEAHRSGRRRRRRTPEIASREDEEGLLLPQKVRGRMRRRRKSTAFCAFYSTFMSLYCPLRGYYFTNPQGLLQDFISRKCLNKTFFVRLVPKKKLNLVQLELLPTVWSYTRGKILKRPISPEQTYLTKNIKAISLI